MNNTIPCIIVDDESGAIHTISRYISQFARLNLIKAYTDPLLALAETSAKRTPHLIYCDIQMPTFSGIDFAESLRDSPHHIIFTTSYPEYALDAFGVRARNYLLKPFNLPKFMQCTQIVLKEFFPPTALAYETEDSFFIRIDQEKTKLTRIPKNDITHIQGANNKIFIYTQGNSYPVYMTFNEIEQRLSKSTGFYRIHRSYIINRGHVKSISGNLVRSGKYEVPMSVKYNTEFMAWVSSIWLKTKRN